MVRHTFQHTSYYPVTYCLIRQVYNLQGPYHAWRLRDTRRHEFGDVLISLLQEALIRHFRIVAIPAYHLVLMPLEVL